jgi:hypothetical protein
MNGRSPVSSDELMMHQDPPMGPGPITGTGVDKATLVRTMMKRRTPAMSDAMNIAYEIRR